MSLLVELRTEKGEVLGRVGEVDGATPVYLPDFEEDQFPTIRLSTDMETRSSTPSR
jgi:hypothetical protein